MQSLLRNQLRNIDKQTPVIDLAELDTYKKLFNSHKDFLFILDLDGIIIDTSDAIDKATGYQKEEWLNKPFTHLKSTKDQSRFNSSFIQLRKGETQTEECSLIHKDGYRIEFEKTSIPIKHLNRIIGYVSMGRDVSVVRQQERELKKANERLNHLQLFGNIGSWEYDVVKDQAYWSKQVYRILGICDDESINASYSAFLSFLHPNDQERFAYVMETSIQNRSSFHCEVRVRRINGEERRIRTQGDVMLDEVGQAVKFIGSIQDITEQRQMEKWLKDSEEHKQMIYDNLEVAIWSVDVETNRLLFITKGFETIYGYSVQDIKDDLDLWKKVIHPQDYQEVLEKQGNLAKGITLRHQYRIYHANGVIKWVLDHRIPVLDDNGKLVRLDGIISDITEQKQAEEKMSYLAHHDALTGLPNRRMFDQNLHTFLNKNIKAPCAILYFNIDRFKHINDTLGHVIGDGLLKEVTNRVRSLAPTKECLSRMDGDEFAIFLADVGANQAERLAEQVLRSIEEPFLIDGYDLYITVSVGISIYPENGKTGSELMNNAIAAMNRAKQLGKNNVQPYSAAMGEGSFKIYSIENDMRKALKNDEFSVYYQPRVCTITGEIVSAEALIRWHHPEKGFMSPAEFIPLAEENGLIFEISDWVATNVCNQLKKWQDEKTPVIPISINVSAQSFLKKKLVPKLKALIRAAQIQPHLIELEITESSYLNNMELVIQALAELRNMGMKIALDDFGTGFSSLTHLKELNIDTLKIDRSFIRNITENEQDRVITTSMIELAHGLKLEVVAEGVETKEQLVLLREKGCDQIQGFLFSKPVPAPEFRGLLERGYLYC